MLEWRYQSLIIDMDTLLDRKKQVHALPQQLSLHRHCSFQLGAYWAVPSAVGAAWPDSASVSALGAGKAIHGSSKVTTRRLI